MASHGDDVRMSSSDGSSSDDGDCVPPTSKRIKVSASSMSTSSGVKDDPISTKESPFYDSNEQHKLYQKSKPFRPPKVNTKKHKLLTAFCNEVEIILQTVSDDDYQAATTLMEPPSKEFERAVVFPLAGTVVGLFADHKAALIQTDAGAYVTDYVEDALTTFPNAKFVVGVGTGYAFDKTSHKLGDVLVSRQISDLRNFKVDSKGAIVNQGEIHKTSKTLVSLFCMNMTFEEDFVCSTTGRVSKAYCGRYASHSSQLDNKEMRDKFLAAVPEAIGGDMEGGELLKFQQNRNIEGIIVIKGVAGYADGCGGKEWQFTAALAALKYAQSKLYYHQSRDNISGIVPHLTQAMSESLFCYHKHLKSYYKRVSKDKLESKLTVVSCNEFINLALIEKPDDEEDSTKHSVAALKSTVQFHRSVNVDPNALESPLQFDRLVTSEDSLILVEGPLGIGKSTLCWELCRKWDTLKSLQHYKIVLLLSLREKHIQTAKKLKDIFVYHNKKIRADVVEEVYKSQGNGVLLIFDGFDEMPSSITSRDDCFIMKLISGAYLTSATHLITSRPSAANRANIFCNSTYKHVKICGFTDESKKNFAEIVFRSRPTELVKFKELVVSNPVVSALMTIPINCAIIAKLYEEDKKWSDKLQLKTMTQLYTALVLILIRKHMIDTKKWNRISEFYSRLEDLPEEVNSMLRKASELAYSGLKKKEVQLIFSSCEVGEDFDHLGLLTKTSEMYVTKNARTFYSFPHLSIQEFLAAWHVSNQPDINLVLPQHLDPLLGLAHKTADQLQRRDSFVKFLAGLIGLTDKLVELVTSMSNIFPHCVFEAQATGKLCNVKPDEEQDVTILNSLDAYVCGYALVHAPVKWNLCFQCDVRPFISSLAHHSQLTSGAISGFLSDLSLFKGGSPLLQNMPKECLSTITTFSTSISDPCLDMEGFAAVLAALRNLSCLKVAISTVHQHDYKLFKGFQNLNGLKEMYLDFEMLTAPGVQELVTFFDKTLTLQAVVVELTSFRIEHWNDCHQIINCHQIIKSALACATITSFETNIPVWISNISQNLKKLTLQKQADVISEITVAKSWCRIADLCRTSAVESLAIPSLPICQDCIPQSYFVNLVAFLNNSMCHNPALQNISIKFLGSDPPSNNYFSLLTQAVRKDPDVLRSSIRRSNSLNDLSKPEKTKPLLSSKYYSCPDLQSPHWHPKLYEEIKCTHMLEVWGSHKEKLPFSWFEDLIKHMN